LSYNITQYKLR